MNHAETDYFDDLARDERRTFDYPSPISDYDSFTVKHRDVIAGMSDADLSDALFDCLPRIRDHIANGAPMEHIGQAVANVIDCYAASVAARVVWGEPIATTLSEEAGCALGLIGVATERGERA